MTQIKKGLPRLTAQIREALIKQSLERRLRELQQTDRNARKDLDALEKPVGHGQFPSVPENHYRIEQLPGYQQICIMQGGAEKLGLSNPYFKSHDGVAGGHSRISGAELINFSSYNYLGLSGHAQVNAAAKAAIDQYGTSVSASRIVSGERPVHRELESNIAHLYGTEDAITFVSGHATNVTTIGHLFSPRDLILHDEYIHNSVLQGIQLSGAKRLSFPHNDWKAADKLLSQNRYNFERVLIVVEGIYSMDGDSPDLPKFVDMRNRHKTVSAR